MSRFDLFYGKGYTVKCCNLHRITIENGGFVCGPSTGWEGGAEPFVRLSSGLWENAGPKVAPGSSWGLE